MELISKAHIELTQQQKVKTPNNPIKRWVGLNNHLPKRHTDGQQVQKSCSMSLIIREMQVKTKQYHLTPVRRATSKNTANSAGEDVEKREHLNTADMKVNWDRY